MYPSLAVAQAAPASHSKAHDAAAATAAPTAPGAAATPAPSEEVTAEARRRFDRGIELYADGDFSLALIEFNRAFQLVSNYRVLYNIGQVNLQLARYADARRALEAYLKQGGSDVPEDRASSVQRDLAMLEQRTAFLTVTTNVPGAEVLIDDLTVGTTPLTEPLLVDAGVHRISARKPGYMPRGQQVTLAGADETTLAIQLDVIPQGGKTIVLRETETTTDERTVWLIAGWSATGLLAASAVVTGFMGKSKSDDLKDLRETETTREDLDDARSSAKTMLLVSDILTASAVVAGGVSLWFTLTPPDKEPERPMARPTKAGVDLGLQLGLSEVRLTGRF
ncbi:MAG: PEGA domain-containing protein [Polyangiaceae bacterium]